MSLKLNIHNQRNNFSLRVEEEFSLSTVTAIVGPSGSGKTSLLRSICGLELKCKGSILFENALWQEGGKSLLPCHKRGIAYVNQDAWLFPHLRVEALLAYAEKRSKHLTQKFSRQTLLTTLGIQELLNRRSHELSGGQRQLVAIAQALLAQPNLLLLDEPVSALDKNNRELVLTHLLHLKNELKLGMLIVSHYPEELLHLADRLLYLDKGRVLFQDEFVPALTNLQYPLAQAEEAFSILDLQDCRVDEHHALLSFRLGKQEIRIAGLQIPGEQTAYRFRVFARDVSVTLQRAEHSSILNILQAEVQNIQNLEQGQCLLRLKLEDQVLLARISRYSLDTLQLRPGKAVYVQIKALAFVA